MQKSGFPKVHHYVGFRKSGHIYARNNKNFDIRVVDTDATSYHSCDVLQSAESEKKKSIYKIIELLLPRLCFC